MNMAESEKHAADRFLQCTCCRAVWRTRDDFLADPEVKLVGYQVHFEELTAGLFLFNHSCGTTLALEVEDFCGLYHGPVFRARATGGPNCKGYCQRRDELRVCPTECECAFVREILQMVRDWPKRGQVA
jgi:hypothetical protein